MEDTDSKNTMPDGSESTGLDDLDQDEISGQVTNDAHDEAARALAEDRGEHEDPQRLPEGEKSEEEIEDDRRARAAQVRVNHRERKLDETIPGGRIMSRSGVLFNAHGQRIAEGGQTLGDRPAVQEPPAGGTRPLGS